MSLINDMLRDLDARGAQLPAAALPLPPARKRRRMLPISLVVLAVALVLGLAATVRLTNNDPPIAAHAAPTTATTATSATAATAATTAALATTAKTDVVPATNNIPPIAAHAAPTTATTATIATPAASATTATAAASAKTDVVPVPRRSGVSRDPAAEPSEPVKFSITRSTPAPPAPDLAQHLQALARQKLQQGQPAAAAELLASAAPPIADHRDYHALLGYAWQQAGQPEQAATVYRQLVTLDSTQGAWWLGLALAEQARGETAAALQAFQRAQTSGGLESRVLRYVEQRIDALSSQPLPSQP